jgi:hypothetical protein
MDSPGSFVDRSGCELHMAIRPARPRNKRTGLEHLRGSLSARLASLVGDFLFVNIGQIGLWIVGALRSDGSRVFNDLPVPAVADPSRSRGMQFPLEYSAGPCRRSVGTWSTSLHLEEQRK